MCYLLADILRNGFCLCVNFTFLSLGLFTARYSGQKVAGE